MLTNFHSLFFFRRGHWRDYFQFITTKMNNTDRIYLRLKTVWETSYHKCFLWFFYWELPCVQWQNNRVANVTCRTGADSASKLFYCLLDAVATSFGLEKGNSKSPFDEDLLQCDESVFSYLCQVLSHSNRKSLVLVDQGTEHYLTWNSSFLSRHSLTLLSK